MEVMNNQRANKMSQIQIKIQIKNFIIKKISIKKNDYPSSVCENEKNCIFINVVSFVFSNRQHNRKYE